MEMNKKEFRSISDFEREYLPKSYREQTSDIIMNDSRNRGTNLAKEYLNEVKQRMKSKDK